MDVVGSAGKKKHQNQAGKQKGKKNKQGGKQQTASGFGAYVCSVLEQLNIAAERAINLEMDLLLKLLLEFNRKGIHFSNVGTQAGGDRKQNMMDLMAAGGFDEDCEGADADDDMEDDKDAMATEMEEGDAGGLDEAAADQEAPSEPAAAQQDQEE